MGRKKKTEEPTLPAPPDPTPAPEPAKDQGKDAKDDQGDEQEGGTRARTGLSPAIRAGLTQLGADVDTAALKAWITTHYPGMDTTSPSFGSTLSTIRKKMGGAPLRTRASAPSGPTLFSSPTSSQTATPTLEDLLRVAQIAKDHGGIGELRQLVASVDDLAQRVGGLDRLRAALDGLDRMSGLFS